MNKSIEIQTAYQFCFCLPAIGKPDTAHAAVSSCTANRLS
jgi:hypothetical protein